MRFLIDLGFAEDSISFIEKNIPKLIREQIVSAKDLVVENIKYIKDLGISNYREVFTQYYDMFLMDNSAFVEVFAKYDKEDLIAKIEKNVSIIEHL